MAISEKPFRRLYVQNIDFSSSGCNAWFICIFGSKICILSARNYEVCILSARNDQVSFFIDRHDEDSFFIYWHDQ